MLPLAAARPCLFSPAPPNPTLRAVPLLPRSSTATLPKPVRLLRPLRATGAGAGPPGASSRPARDRVIDFGKHKGQMLGTLPPAYLRWVVAELDYGDTAPWARLARDVLDDPVYVDRAEWEHAHRFLRGDSKYDYVYDDAQDGSDGPLQEMAERFGWDLSDEDGWSRLDYRLLGTSYGGRIPRKADRTQSSGGALFDSGAAADSDGDGPKGKRDERRERMRMRRDEQVRTAKMGILGVSPGALGTPRKARIGAAAKKDILGLGRGSRSGDVLRERAVPPGKGGEGGSPFPGRQAFLDKVRKLKGDDS
ncbi:uncharacterized protein LOC124695418 [Lolium rigidum]|uniref:uncharacterized protein LOC124695418 n=1 Tax=Lolium rigidum TaxID=89674 RepID=UPI001F5D448F|nr:uncharacterized protein LOC124695418 [Lolium rigidum]